MLLENFYTSGPATSTDSVTWTVPVRLNAGHPLYEGHFPEQPVVPGVCLLQLIRECAEAIRKQRLQYTLVNSCKFLSALDPNQSPELLLTLTLKETETGTLLLQSEGKTGETCFIKLKASLTIF